MLSASIVTYHTSFDDLSRVINCVLKSSVSVLYVIDNSSNDKLREVTALSDKIKYIHIINLGYGSGHNIAIREAIERRATYHVVINPDIYFEEHILEYISDYMDANDDIGLVMPKVLYPDGELQYLCKLLPTPADLFLRRFNPLKNYAKKQNERYELHFTDYNSIMEVPSLSGCFMFMRVSVLKQIGGFDERFFMYAEDLDLCRRIGEVAKTVYYPKVFVYHEYAKGSYKNKKLLKYHIQSVVKYFNKWGWVFDNKRRLVNQRFLAKYRSGN